MRVRPRGKSPARRASHNSGDHDAHYETPLMDARHCVIAADVMRKAPPRLNEMIKISGSMNNAVHLNRVAANDVEYQI